MLISSVIGLLAVGMAQAAYSSTYGYGGGKGFASAGSSGGAFAGSAYAPNFPFAPLFDPAEFQHAISRYISGLQNQQSSAASMTFSSPDATAFASSSLYPDDEYAQDQFARQQAFFNNLQRQAQYSSGAYAPNYASASAAYGPGGIHQTASINPANPHSPNINTRFASSGIGGGGPGYFGVSTSSFSDSSDVNGQKSGRRGASTTVNDNGRVTTYHTHS